MSYSLRNRDFSSRRLSQEQADQEGEQTTVPKVSQFRRMFSSNSLQAQVIPEEVDMAKAKRIMFSHHKSSSDPTRLTSSPMQDKNSLAWSQDKHAWLSRENEAGQTPIKPVVPAPKSSRTRPNQDQGDPSLALPTLPLFLVLAIITCTCCYLSDYLPTTHSTNQTTQLQDYSIIWAANSVSDKISTLVQLSSDHGWVLGPVLIGVSITTVTLMVLNIDKLGGEVVEPSPSLHLGEGVAVMNGILMFLYFLFYNIRVKPEENQGEN